MQPPISPPPVSPPPVPPPTPGGVLTKFVPCGAHEAVNLGKLMFAQVEQNGNNWEVRLYSLLLNGAPKYATHSSHQMEEMAESIIQNGTFAGDAITLKEWHRSTMGTKPLVHVSEIAWIGVSEGESNWGVSVRYQSGFGVILFSGTKAESEQHYQGVIQSLLG